ncbi:MAG: Ig-like domain-containing protein [Planctomycetota bacterium]
MRSLFSWRRPSRPAPVRRVRLGVESLEERAQPATLVAPDLLTQCDTGFTSFDNLTRENRPTFAGTSTSPSGTSVTLMIDGLAFGSHTITQGGGESFTLQPPTPLGDGVHVARFYDSKTFVLSNTLTFTIDRTPPATPTAPTLVSATDPTHVVFRLQGVAGDRLHLNVAGKELTTVAATGSPQNVTVNFTANGIDPLAPFDAYVVAEDTAGNLSLASLTSSTTPVVAGPAPPSDLRLDSASDGGVFDNDNITSNTTLTFNGTASPGQTIALYVDGTVWTSQVVGASGLFTISAGPLAEGPHQAWVTAADAAGHVGTASAPITFTIDVTAPVLSAITLTPPNLSPNNDNVQESGVFRFHLSEPAYVVVHFLDSDDYNLGSIPLDLLDAGDHEFDLAVPQFGEGTYTIVLLASDIADNVGNLESTTFVVDITPPAIPNFALAPGQDTGPSSTDGVTNITSPILAGVGEPGSTIELSENGTLLDTTTVASDGTWTLTVPLTEGVHFLNALARDAAGNTAISGNVTITIDTTIVTPPPLPANLAPTMTLPATLNGYRNGTIVVGAALSVGDPDSSRLLVLLSIDEGTISAPVIAGLNFVTGIDTDYVSMEGPIAAVNAALRALVFHVTPGYTGAVAVNIVADDLGLNGSGGAKQTSGSFGFTIANRAPQAASAAASYSMTGNTSLDIAAPGLATRFSDADNDSLTIALVTPPPVGTLVVNADGSFRYTPPTGYVGTITFAVRASDGVDSSALKWVTVEVKSPYGLRRSR